MKLLKDIPNFLGRLMSKYLGEREAIFVRVPVCLKRQAELCAIIQGLTINEWIIKCIEEGLSKNATRGPD